MSRELTLIEKMGVEFEKRDGLFYPLMDSAGSDTFGDGVGASNNVKTMEEKLLAESGTGKSFAEIYALRTQVRLLVEEIVMKEVVNTFH